MERMYNERIPSKHSATLAPRHRYDESGGENSGARHDFHDRFRDDRGGGRRAGHHGQNGGRAHGRGRDHHVRFEDEEFDDFDREERFDDDENPFANNGLFGRRRDHRRHADNEDREHHRGRHNRGDPNSMARVKLSIPKFTGKEDEDAYLEWAEQCDQIFRIHDLSDQRCVNLASVEFSGYALTWWNQIQENQLVLGRDHINTWDEMKRVMRRRFVPSSYQHDLRNRLQMLKQGKRSVDEYYKEMELLLVRAGIREDDESKMAKFLTRLNEEISDFVEMFPYHTLQDLVDQAMRPERKIQQETRGRSNASHSIAASWHKQQPGNSFGGGRFQGAAARSSPPIAPSKMAVSTASSPANPQRPAASTAAPTVVSVATSSTRSREIVCHKCHGRGHVAAQCPSRRTMIVNEHSE